MARSVAVMTVGSAAAGENELVENTLVEMQKARLCSRASKLVAHLGGGGVPDGRGLLIALEALISLNLLRSKRFYALLCATLLCYSRGKLSAEASGQGDL